MSENKIKLIIDDREVEVAPGTSLLKAARVAGRQIPALCWNDGLDEHITSCMICLVKNSAGKLVPSCSVTAAAGEHIITDDPEIREARQMALNLLLSEHVGDCEAPCQIGCPAHMNIPQMNRLIAEGRFEESLITVKRDIALPAVLGRICPAPCEGACHRRTVDEAVSICLLKRFVGDENDVHPFAPHPSTGFKVAVIGAGPAGLAAAYYLQLRGVSVVLTDRGEKPGGMLLTAIPEDKLPQEVLNKEINAILSTGVVFRGGVEVDDKYFDLLKSEFDAVVIATGNIDDITKSYQLKGTPTGLEVNRNSYETSEAGVFAVGNVLRSSKLAVRSVGQGKEVAFSVLQYLNGQKVKGEPRLFNSRFGKLNQLEFSEYLKEAAAEKRHYPDRANQGMSREEAVKEAERCMHCDCRAIDHCKLRDYSSLYEVDQKKYQTSARRFITKTFHPGSIVYEPQKCIKCGICVKITEKYREQFGLTFIGRGFDVVIGIPFDESLGAALEKTAAEVADACPTGAMEKL